MATIIGTASSAAWGTAGSHFGSLLNLNAVSSLGKVLNADNYPVLAGKYPGLAWFGIPAAGLLEASHDGGTTWFPIAAGGASSYGSCIWFVDGYTSRTNGTGGNWSVVFLNMQNA